MKQIIFCDDCPLFKECDQATQGKFRVPKSYQDIQMRNMGFMKPQDCQKADEAIQQDKRTWQERLKEWRRLNAK